MMKNVKIIGAGLAGSEAALQLARRGIRVTLVEMRPQVPTAVHKTDACAELVCSNSLKSTKPESASGMLKAELAALGSDELAKVIASLEEDMAQAYQRLDFEAAARIRDQLVSLKAQTEKTDEAEALKRLKSVYRRGSTHGTRKNMGKRRR